MRQRGAGEGAYRRSQDLMRQANRWLQGARGEQQVGSTLQALEREGWPVLHDVVAPGHGNIDHVAVGPPGVFVIETKSHSGSIRCDGRQLYRGRRPLERDPLGQVRRHGNACSPPSC